MNKLYGELLFNKIIGKNSNVVVKQGPHFKLLYSTNRNPFWQIFYGNTFIGTIHRYTDSHSFRVQYIVKLFDGNYSGPSHVSFGVTDLFVSFTLPMTVINYMQQKLNLKVSMENA